MNAPESRSIPIGQALPGISVYPLPEDEKVEWVFLLARTVDSDGVWGWRARLPPKFSRSELLGALVSYVDAMRREEANEWLEEGETPQGSDQI